MTPRIWRRSSRAVSTAMALLAALGIAVGSLGFPVAHPTSSGAFPCQGHGCGCTSALACWLGCCCLTPAQRLEWAKENGVKPPPELLALLSGADSEAAPASDTDSATSSCCHTDSQCCHHGATKSCCHEVVTGEDGVPMEDEPASSDDSQPEQPIVTVTPCQGLGHFWIAGGQPLAPPPPPVTFHLSDGDEPLILATTDYQSQRDRPPTRPG